MKAPCYIKRTLEYDDKLHFKILYGNKAIDMDGLMKHGIIYSGKKSVNMYLDSALSH